MVGTGTFCTTVMVASFKWKYIAGAEAGAENK